MGPVEARDDEGRRLDLGARQQRFVLAVLLLEANHVVPATRLVGLLWPDDPPRSARQSIQVRISRLRSLLGASVPVVSEGAGYRIRIDPLAVDAHRFRARVSAARGAVEDGADDRAVALFRQALSLWSGEPLAGAAAEAVRLQLSHGLEEARLVAVEDCLDAELRLGHHASVLDELTDLVRTHPTRERLVGQLMLGLHRCGQTARALEVARQTRELLAGELGIDPGIELRDLELAILRDDPSLLVRPPHHTNTGRVEGAGSVPKPEPATDAAAGEPDNPARTLTPPAQLPPAVSGFTGRRAQLRDLDRYVTAGTEDAAASRLVVVSGMGGLGKTALTLHWAHQVADRFPDGQLYLDLRGHAAVPAVRPIEALAHFLLGLGFEPARIPHDLDAATAAYRTALAGRSLLVVLDNAADPAQVRPLLPAAPGCLTLVTSRDRLSGLVARDGADRLALDTLTTEEAIDLLERLLGPTRAAAETEAVTALAKVCGRLPLALRIAAGFLTDNPAHTVRAYVEQLQQGDLLDALTVDGDDDAAIRATFDLSYQRLSDPERRMFRLLGLVPGPDVTPGAAAALAAIPVADAGRQLSRLCASHLLTEHVPGRFMLHDLLREYARGRAEATSRPGIAPTPSNASWRGTTSTPGTRTCACPPRWSASLRRRFRTGSPPPSRRATPTRHCTGSRTRMRTCGPLSPSARSTGRTGGCG
nr:BTAD domain-containing putative transcriptional regulator [Actinopolymorpha pittospori]